MQPIISSGVSSQNEFNQSLSQVLGGNVDFGSPTGIFDANGQPLTFTPDNMNGIVIRIGSVSNPNALPAAWAGNAVDLTIAHNLGRVPYGFIVLAKYAAADVYYGTVPPTSMNITLQTTNDATDITIFILV